MAPYTGFDFLPPNFIFKKEISPWGNNRFWVSTRADIRLYHFVQYYNNTTSPLPPPNEHTHPRNTATHSPASNMTSLCYILCPVDLALVLPYSHKDPFSHCPIDHYHLLQYHLHHLLRDPYPHCLIHHLCPSTILTHHFPRDLFLPSYAPASTIPITSSAYLPPFPPIPYLTSFLCPPLIPEHLILLTLLDIIPSCSISLISL